MDEFIKIRGARQHNLKNINLDIPKNKLVVVTGVSGSGKSSLVFDTIYAEGQRRYVESLSAYARQFLGVMDKPDVDLIEGLSPAIAIDQKSVSHNPRSTVGTITEIYDFLRLLFARIGQPHCPNCGREVRRQSPEQIAEVVISNQASEIGPRGLRILVLAPIVRDKKGEFSKLFENLKKQGYAKARIDGEVRDLAEDFDLIRTNKHSIDVVIDRLVIQDQISKTSAQDGSSSGGKNQKYNEIKSRLVQSIEAAAKLASGHVIIAEVLDKTFDLPEFPKKLKDHLFSENFTCPVCNLSLPELEPRLFSFNSPHGACPKCAGIGYELKVDPKLVLNPELSIAEGGLLPWARFLERGGWFSRLLESVACELSFSLATPIKDLPEKVKKVLLYGTGDSEFQVSGRNRYGHLTSFHENFEGVLANLNRRHKETESEYARSEIEKYMSQEDCPLCLGARLKKDALAVTVVHKNIMEVSHLSLAHLYDWVLALALTKENKALNARELEVARPIVKEVETRSKFLLDVGLAYLTLSRPSSSLAGGEAQRIRLASQIGSGLSGVIYCLDEPSIGLHARDQGRLITTLKRLRDLKNSVLVVEHDPQTMNEADFLIDIGPGAGKQGGEVVSQGTPKQVREDRRSLTGQYLSGRRKIELRIIKNESGGSPKTVMPNSSFLILRGCQEHNLKNIDVKFPLGKFVCVTGVSGSGKSTLVNETLYRALRRHLGLLEKEKVGQYRLDEGFEAIDKVININQAPIGRTPRSNPVTYIKTFDEIRKLYARTKEARIKGYEPGRFSFNVSGGRCENCLGDGSLKVEMQFLPDVYVKCDLCQGRRYNQETLEVDYDGKNIYEVLEMTVDEGLKFFGAIPQIQKGLETLSQVGLGYIHLGQPATTLSGGEAQRVKLASELAKRATGKTLYLLDEPTTGLHFADLEKLLRILKTLVAKGNSIIVIEHNLEVIAAADYVIDLGPDGGEAGGAIIAEGPPLQLLRKPQSYTGQELKKHLGV